MNKATAVSGEETRYPFPPTVAAYAGEIIDLDAHECVPVNRWVEEFGKDVKDFVNAVTYTPPGQQPLIFNPDIGADDAEINPHNVFHLKMEKAPGAFDFDRRIEVMDFIGIKRQIMYPGGLGLLGAAFLANADNPEVMKTLTGDRRQYGRKLMSMYNDWVARLYGEQNRLMPVAILADETVDELYATAKSLINRGVRLFQLPPDVPPGGVSPADPEMDKVWDLFAQSGVAILMHIGAADRMFATLKWRDAPAFKGWMSGGEFSLDPWTVSNMHLPVQNFLTTMVLGGVFDRHPALRLGTAEFTGHWVGPFAENMDMWYKNTPFSIDIGDRLLKKQPSEYVRDNIRVACFDFEPVGKYIDRFPWVADVLSFASDYPHHEGGKRPFENFSASLEGHSEETKHKFFVKNGAFLVGD